MPLVYSRCSMYLRPSHPNASSIRSTREMLRRTLERVWVPFNQGKTGPDLNTYQFRENLDALCAQDGSFTCQINGTPGSARLLEDFLLVLLSGFDILGVKLDQRGSSSVAELMDPCQFHGHYLLAHTRSFLGWKPETPVFTDATASLPVASLNGPRPQHFSLFTAAPTAGQSGSTCSTAIRVPFSAHVEGGRGNVGLSHLVLRSPALSLLSQKSGCPEEVQQCLQSPQALKMLATLRRAHVKSEMISARTLASACKKKESWTSALGIL